MAYQLGMSSTSEAAALLDKSTSSNPKASFVSISGGEPTTNSSYLVTKGLTLVMDKVSLIRRTVSLTAHIKSISSITAPVKTVCHVLNASSVLRPGQVHCIASPDELVSSSVLHLLSGSRSCTSGMITADGIPVEAASYKCSVGFVESRMAPYPYLSNRRNITIELRRRRTCRTSIEVEERVDDILQFLEIEGDQKSRRNTPLEHLKVQIARELVADPPVLFVRSPMIMIEYHNHVLVAKMLRRIAIGLGKTVVVSAAILPLSMYERLDTIMLIGEGGHVFGSGEVAGVVSYFASLKLTASAYMAHYSPNDDLNSSMGDINSPPNRSLTPPPPPVEYGETGKGKGALIGDSAISNKVNLNSDEFGSNAATNNTINFSKAYESTVTYPETIDGTQRSMQSLDGTGAVKRTASSSTSRHPTSNTKGKDFDISESDDEKKGGRSRSSFHSKFDGPNRKRGNSKNARISPDELNSPQSMRAGGSACAAAKGKSLTDGFRGEQRQSRYAAGLEEVPLMIDDGETMMDVARLWSEEQGESELYAKLFSESSQHRRVVTDVKRTQQAVGRSSMMAMNHWMDHPHPLIRAMYGVIGDTLDAASRWENFAAGVIVFLVLLMSALFVERQDNDQGGMQNKRGIVFFLFLVLMEFNVLFIPTYKEETDCFLEQRNSGTANAVAQTIIIILKLAFARVMILGVVAGFIFYVAQGLGWTFVMFWGVTSFMHALMVYTLTVLIMRPRVVLIVSFLFSMYSALFSGFLINLTTVNQILGYVSAIRWGYGAVIHEYLAGKPYDCDAASLRSNATSYCYTGDQYLQLEGLINDSSAQSLNVLVITSSVVAVILVIRLHYMKQ